MSTPQTYRRWFEYEQDAHAKVFASIDSVPVEARGRPEYHKAVSWMAHLTAARALWLGRLGHGPAFGGDFFPEKPDLEQVKADWTEVAARWTSYLANADTRELERVFEYNALDGPRFRNRVEDILTQVFGHSWYHRGQIAQLVKALGGQPAVTDFVFWTREAVPSSPA